MTTDDQVLIPEDQLWSAVGDSLGHRTCPAKNHKRSGSPNLEYIRPQYKRRPYIRQTNIVPATILSSEPRSVAGHVKKREGRNTQPCLHQFPSLVSHLGSLEVVVMALRRRKVVIQVEEMKKMRAMKEAKTTRMALTMKTMQGLRSKRGQAMMSLKARLAAHGQKA